MKHGPKDVSIHGTGIETSHVHADTGAGKICEYDTPE